jgi:hypothetical protein
VKVATNPRKLRKQSEQKGEKRLAGFCHNLLLFSGLGRLRQVLANFGFPLAKQVLSQLSYTPTAYSFHFNHLRTAAQLVFSTVIKT